MPLQLEHTDTSSGEANYCWVRRAHMLNADQLSRRALVRRVKAWAGLTGVRCEVEDYGGDLAIRPRGICQVVFVTYCEPEYVQGEVI